MIREYFTGRPAKYTDSDVLANKIADYFEDCDTQKKPYTVTGLSVYLGFEDKKSLKDYEERAEFSTIIKRAILYIESYYETTLTTSDKATGVIFWLKNHGWKDKVETDNKHEHKFNLPEWFD